MTRPGFLIVGREFAVQGDQLRPGDAAPDFVLTANDWSPKTLSDYAGKVAVISVVPSLDTRVCAAQTRRFNEAAASLGEAVIVLTVSADLPYAQARWCAAEGIDRVYTLSDHKTMRFASDYGVHVTDIRITQRAVFVIDGVGVVRHAQYVHDIDDEPDYDAALSAARALLSG